MIGTLISIILTLVILGVVYWGARRLLALIPLEEPFRTIIDVVLVIIMVVIIVWVIAALLGVAGIPVRGFRW